MKQENPHSFKIHHASNAIRWRFIMSKNEIGEDSPIPKFIYLKIRRRDGVESLTTLEEGEFKVHIDGSIRSGLRGYVTDFFFLW